MYQRLKDQHTNKPYDWTVLYDFALYSCLSNSFKNAFMGTFNDVLNVSSASRAFVFSNIGFFFK